MIWGTFVKFCIYSFRFLLESFPNFSPQINYYPPQKIEKIFSK